MRFISAVELAVCFGPQGYFLNMTGACRSGGEVNSGLLWLAMRLSVFRLVVSRDCGLNEMKTTEQNGAVEQHNTIKAAIGGGPSH